MMSKLTPWLERTQVLLNRNKVMDVVAIQLRDFIHVHKCRPELIVLSNLLRSTVVKELMESGMDSSDAVAEPIWIDEVPILFRSKLLGDNYMILWNKAAKAKEVL